MEYYSLLGIIPVVIIAIIYYCYDYIFKNEKKQIKTEKSNDFPVFIMLAVALLIHIILAGLQRGYGVDITCFGAWSDMVYKQGINNFYTYCFENKVFVDYPPGYMLVLYVVGFIKSVFHMNSQTSSYWILLKFVPALADIGCAYVIYRFAKENLKGKWPIILSMMYAFSPFTFLNSSLWGQVDSVFAFFAVLSFYFLYNKKLSLAAAMYAISMFIKPQALIFFPVYMFFIIELFIQKDPDAIKKSVKSVLIGLVVFFGGVMLFSKNFNPLWVFELYSKTLSSYPYASLNAFNFYTMFGKNWLPVESKFFIFSYNTWSTIFLSLGVIGSGCIYFLYKGKEKLFLAAAFINITMFIMAAKMHERYLFPAIVLLLAAYVAGNKKSVLFTFASFSVLFYFNIAYTLYNALLPEPKYHLMGETGMVFAISLLNVLVYVYFVTMLVINIIKNNKKPLEPAVAAPVNDNIRKKGSLGR